MQGKFPLVSANANRIDVKIKMPFVAEHFPAFRVQSNKSQKVF
ncbi:MAG: hypothetical protein ACR2N3_19250 [Pyrinomonadaceae bacterium]